MKVYESSNEIKHILNTAIDLNFSLKSMRIAFISAVLVSSNLLASLCSKINFINLQSQTVPFKTKAKINVQINVIYFYLENK